MQLPFFPAGVTEINHQLAVQKEAGTVYYLHGHAGGVALRLLVSGKLLPFYARTLRVRPSDGVWI